MSVAVSPSVEAVVEVRVTEGEEVVLECEVTGNPRPTVVWSRPDSPLPPGSQTSCPANSCLNIPSVSRADTGSYLCTADNGVGQPDSASSELVVQCKIFCCKPGLVRAPPLCRQPRHHSGD